MSFEDYWKDLSVGATYDSVEDAAKDVWEDMTERVAKLDCRNKELVKVLDSVLELIRKDQSEYGESDNLIFAIEIIKATKYGLTDEKYWVYVSKPNQVFKGLQYNGNTTTQVSYSISNST